MRCVLSPTPCVPARSPSFSSSLSVLVSPLVNPDNLDLQPETVATGQARPWKVTLLPGHCGLEANMESLGKQVVLVRGRGPRAANTRASVWHVVSEYVPSSLKSLVGPVARCLLELF